LRRCIIHIGHPKTATTYLQHCLHLNAELFAQQNYWVPGDFTDFGYYDLLPLSRQGAIISGNLAPLHTLMCDGPGDRIPQMANFVFGAPGMPRDCDVLLSSELFFYYVRAVARVVQIARSYGLTPQVVAYLPRQDRAAVTGYLQNVRYHGYTEGVVDFLVHDKNMAYCQYMNVLGRLLALAPDLAITIRSFDRRFLVGGDVFSDFLASIDARVDPASCVRPAAASNPGLLLEHYELLRAATILEREDAAARLRSAPVVLSAEDRARIQGFYYRPGVENFLTDHFLADNHRLVDRFLSEADESERDYWRCFAPAAGRPNLDQSLMERLGQDAFS
jgi:hypothetical protein